MRPTVTGSSGFILRDVSCAQAQLIYQGWYGERAASRRRSRDPPHPAAGCRRRRRRPRRDATAGLGATRAVGPGAAPARQPPLPAAAGGYADHAPDRAHRRADDGEPFLRQPPRDGPLPGARSRARRRAAATSAGAMRNSNPDPAGRVSSPRGPARRASSRAEPTQTWNASHLSYNGGRMDGFVKASGDIAMRFWDKHDLPFTYALAKYFPIGERYFCSVLAQTYPNRRFLFAGTSSGTVDDKADAIRRPRPTAPSGIASISTRSTGPTTTRTAVEDILAAADKPARAPRTKTDGPVLHRRRSGRLPAFTFIDPITGRPRRRIPRTSRSGSALWPASSTP